MKNIEKNLFKVPSCFWKSKFGILMVSDLQETLDCERCIERDVRDLTQVGYEVKFMQFMLVIASCTAQLLNLASVARDVGISQPTADRWLSIFVASNIVYLLRLKEVLQTKALS